MPPDHPNQPHDGLIRTALDSLDNARAALAAALPSELVARLDLARLRRVPARLVDAMLAARESDAVWEVPFANVDQTLLAQLMAEVQSKTDVDLILRTLGLQVRFWERHRRLGQCLTPVIPLVISHGATWRAPRTMLERLARDFLTRLLRYTYHTANGDIHAVHGTLRANLDPTMEIQMGTLAEQLIERGIQKGRAEGMEEGLAKGQRETLVRLLTLKFGPLSAATTDRLASATRDELAEYTLRILTADTLDTVFE